MRLIIIGAGRGSRLNALTEQQPKCYTPIGGQRIIDWILDASRKAGLSNPVFIAGYQIGQIRRDFPRMTICHNTGWQNNNILASLFCAEDYMGEGFACSYSDILFRPSVIQKALEHPADIVLCVDTRWRYRYAGRTRHPEDDAEKILAKGDRVTRIHRDIPSREASGEYIGVARFSPCGAALLREHYHRVRERFSGKPWRGASSFEKAYLIHLLQEMIEQGVAVHMVTTAGEYMEIDTEEDYEIANRTWAKE